MDCHSTLSGERIQTIILSQMENHLFNVLTDFEVRNSKRAGFISLLNKHAQWIIDLISTNSNRNSSQLTQIPQKCVDIIYFKST